MSFVSTSLQRKINAPVSVSALFSDDMIRPQVFSWAGETYPIRTINAMYYKEEGRSRCYYFAASSDQAFFKLAFHSASLSWKLLDLYQKDA